MQLPPALQRAIDNLSDSFGMRQLTEARQELSSRYRESQKQRQLMTTDAQRASYLAARMPATFAAVHAALVAIEEQMPNFNPRSLLDLGAGPGTATWAVCGHFPSVEKVTLLEKDLALLKIGQHMAQASEQKVIQEASWQAADLENLTSLPAHDMLVLSYCINELQPQKVAPLIELCWQATQEVLVVVEPGTPAGFERIRAVRRQLIDLGGYLVAPCPHHLACPMADGDWCHFAARVERSSLHRRLKSGQLGHEDEKFSYVVASKTACSLPKARILRHPDRHSGHVTLKLCTPAGVQQPTISKKMGELYKLARKAEWGDPFAW